MVTALLLARVEGLHEYYSEERFLRKGNMPCSHKEGMDKDKGTQSAFSVLISVYAKEYPAALDEALASVASNTLLPLEVVLVKDGALPKELESVIEKWQQGNRLKLVAVGYAENKGLARALSFGLKFVKTELVARMDSDDVCAKDRFEKQLRFMEEKPDVAVSSGYIEEFLDKPGVTVSVRSVPLTGEAVHERMKSRSPFNHMAVMYRKSAVLAAGGYQEVSFFEDYDLWFRMDAMGFKGANLPDTLVYARIGNDMIGRRHGLSYAKCELNFLKRAREKGFLNTSEYIKMVLLRVPPRLLHKPMLVWIYRNILRTPSPLAEERVRTNFFSEALDAVALRPSKKAVL